jgi:heat-inducible transcriptional repressor
MAWLERENYIARPYTSAGGTPSDKGYRHYVESLVEEAELPPEEQCTIRHLFHQVEYELEEWIRLAAALLARRIMNIAVVTLPQGVTCRLKRLELIALQEFLALLVIILHEAKTRQQLLFLDHTASQDELTSVANKLNACYGDMTCTQIESQNLELTPVEGQVTEAIQRIMQAEDEQRYGELCLDGLRSFLSQPEFAYSAKKIELLAIFEDKTALREVLSSVSRKKSIQVIIGSENKEEALRECSVVVSSYGVSGGATGTIGVIGPTRMPYAHAISAVRYLSSVMSELVGRLYGEG